MVRATSDARVTPPLRKLTVPVGMAVPEAGTTVSVRVTLDPEFTVVEEAVRVLVVPIIVGVVTVTLTAAEVLPEYVVLAGYDAVMECTPTLRVVVA